MSASSIEMRILCVSSGLRFRFINWNQCISIGWQPIHTSCSIIIHTSCAASLLLRLESRFRFRCLRRVRWTLTIQPAVLKIGYKTNFTRNSKRASHFLLIIQWFRAAAKTASLWNNNIYWIVEKRAVYTTEHQHCKWMQMHCDA